MESLCTFEAHSNFDMSTWPVPTYFCWMCSHDRLMFIRSAAMAAVRARRRGGFAATGVTRRALGGARAVAAGARRSFWPLAAFCPAESCRGRGARSLPLWRLKGYIGGKRLSQSGLMLLAWASAAKQRVNKNQLGL